MTRSRAINTVVDVAVALLVVGIAVFILSTANFSDTPEQDRFDTDRTAAVLGTATFDVTYSVEPTLAEAAETSDAIEYDESETQQQRVAHGPVATHLGDAAIGNLVIDSEQVTGTGRQYQSAIDRRFRTQLSGSQFETRVTAHWEPYPDASISGKATIGVEPPPNRDIRTRELTVPSGFDRARGAAISAVEDGGGYGSVAEVVAGATIDGYLPVVESKQALERDGSVMILTRYRYERLATLLEEATVETIRDEIRQTDSDPAEANEELIAALAARLEPELRQHFERPRAAARGVSTGTITVTVRTWDP
ncbi:DUF7284 family protein [Halovenus sp. HT40]|uniref:DUF7284 family protein n=1 Tax=Halovenus sp. HT40 TaxID=3126691 RepID=UPI00300F17FD